MRVGISAIAWDRPEDDAVAALLRQHALDAIDIAPGKYFPDPSAATAAQALEVRRWWAERGLAITGMQSLLFGTVGLNLFGPAPVRHAMLEHLGAVARIAGLLGAERLVFGSPRNRDRQGLADAEAFSQAVDFFRLLAQRARDAGVCFCLEPNPPRYGANFMTTTAETAAVVAAVADPAIRLQLDTGALHINGEDIEQVLTDFGHLIGHVHASEPDLITLGDGGVDHGAAALALRRHMPQTLVTVEMVATAQEPHLTAIHRALAVASRCYGDADEGSP
jgi:sugar phosphate isomerase/epimerase